MSDNTLGLLGVNLAGAEFGSVGQAYGTGYTYPTHAEIDYEAASGMNVIRLPFLWERLQPTLNGPLDPDELARIEDVVNYATEKGLKVALDVHDYGSYQGQLVGSAAVPNSAFADLWGKLAGQFASNPNVMFDLMNEPQQSSASAWLSSVNSAIGAIRSAGAAQEVLVSGIGWDGAWTWTTGPNAGTIGAGVVDPDNNYAFDVHQYLDQDGSGTQEAAVSSTIGSERLAAITTWAESTGHRLFLGEFGAGNDPTSLAALGDMLAYMQKHADVWQGGTYWAAGPWWGDYMYSAEPSNGVDAPQMKVLEGYAPTATPLAAQEPASTLPASTPSAAPPAATLAVSAPVSMPPVEMPPSTSPDTATPSSSTPPVATTPTVSPPLSTPPVQASPSSTLSGATSPVAATPLASSELDASPAGSLPSLPPTPPATLLPVPPAEGPGGPASPPPLGVSFDATTGGFDTGVTPVLTGRVTGGSGPVTVEIDDGDPAAGGRILGDAAVASDGTWQFSARLGPGAFDDLRAVATDAAGSTASAASPYTLALGVLGQPYRAAEYDWAPDGSYGYVDYARDGTALVTATDHGDGSHLIETAASRQSVTSLHDDTIVASGMSDTFVFTTGFGQDEIRGFVASGPGHDSLDIEGTSSAALGDLLRHATMTAAGVALHVAPGDTITLDGVSIAALARHPNDVTVA